MIKTIIVGPKGKMGRLITQIAAGDERFTLVAGVGPKGRDYIGQDLGQVAMISNELGVEVVDDLARVIESCEVIIDFSSKEMGLETLRLAKKYKKALVCGTTGFSPKEKEAFHQAGEVIPILYAANTSKLVNVMNRLLQLTAAAIGDETDIEIVEMHDRWKKDAPSGTAKEMGELIAHELGEELSELAVHGREGAGERKKGSIGYHSVRMGDTPSSHTVFFGGFGERLEISHHSTDWRGFAKGACDCAVFLANQKKGYYTVADVLKL
ncbi:4-hydroxy-tetrahydrodipicolinate reductase [Enterococcus raffinosus]|uniref:4-hydroxy-tetrahydrodipicolinate reductase n=1 Tax=Enterococcus raffinosus TaxID=71452 RepID=A0AAW8T9Q7_9ENTE|nr:4-hydroxy-tetrahydrodipicolinate reductase [Enterococcus raffinosus]MDT2522061.1 4-hydroxy-tetrahydrodipicolinate reductase [Enterococcus raffinosus]MDT2528405.1 4-hydroxy-tetrahydrodipicolinate reductase [Enterococcus raffinosus]MDT2533128.1 4-hydroxy-tetrahydrodipicolinate reductase [Enterococcus raffinosus]MDT2543568.1 4-hydroxy-tetrahydrodipicolinate reductase [Enterococcus raffinosus]MDT2553682.1 4-hydroxy-tetrahydrodipicolinate reductase [Enterococcus raffinosus]